MMDSVYEKSRVNLTWKILIVDDDEDDFLITRELLREAKGRKFDIHWVSTFEAGRSELVADHYDAVLVDYDLGLHSGIELIREANQRGYPSPLILYTGRGNYEVDVEAMQAGATLYLTKGEVNALLLERVIRYAIERKQTEAKLRASEERLRLSEEKFSIVFDRSPTPTFLLSLPEARFVDMNPAYLNLIGFNKADLIGKTSLEQGILREPQIQKAALQALAENGAVSEVEMYNYTKSGALRITLANLETIAIEGKPYVLGTAVDITGRKHAEQALLESEARWHEFLESTHDNFIALDREWRFTYANRHYCDVMRMEPQELIGQSYWDLFPQYLGTSLEKTYRQVMEEGAPLHYRQGGIYTKNLYDVSVYPTQEGLAIFSTDRTEELRYQQQLENAHARLEAVLQAMPVAVWIANQNGQLVFKNEQADQIWGGNAPLSDSIDGYQEYKAWFLKDGQPVAADAFPVAQALKTGRPGQPEELLIRRFDGTEGAVLAMGAPIKDLEGRLTGAVAINLDITERRAAEEAVRKSEEHFRSILESTHDRVFFLDRNWIIQYANRQFTDAYQGFAKDFTGRPILEVFPRYRGTILEQNYRKVMEERVPMHFELESAYNDALFEVSAYPTEDGISVFAHDRTEENRARKALRESQTRLERAQQIAHLGSWELEVTENRLTWSDEVYRIFGLQPQEFDATYEGFLERVHPEDRAAVDNAYTSSLQDRREGYEIEHRVVRAHTGEVRFVHEKCEHYWDANGQVVRSTGMVHDITERKQAEAALLQSAALLRERNDALRASEAVLEAFFANSPGILNIEDENFRYLKTDPMTPTYFGLDRQSIVGKAVKDLSPEFIANFGPMLRRVIESGQPETLEVMSPVSARAEKMAYWQATYFPVPLPGGKRGIGVMGVEITEQKKAEESLRKLSRAVEFSPATVVITDTNGTIEYVNPTFTALTGYSLEEALGKNPRILKSGETPAAVYRQMWEALRSGGQWQGELCNRKKNGELYWEAALISPISNEKGEITHFIAVKQDITERKQVEKDLQHYAQELERSNQALQDFAFIASHDLQEPLRKVIMFGEMLKRDLGSAADTAAAGHLDRMQSAAARMQTMINGLLELSRVNTQGAKFTPVDLNTVVAEVVSDLEAHIGAVAGQVQIEPLPTVEADALQMRQLFQNLIGNAIKFHKPGVPPVVRVSATVTPLAPQRAEIQVEDNGIGFEQEYAERIFQPFQRLHGRMEYEGTGLGLAICQKIVDRHHGKIQAQSAPGQGTRFIITLPG